MSENGNVTDNFPVYRILHIDIPELTSIMVLNLIMSAGRLMNVRLTVNINGKL